jgi:hypothetical protein
VISVENEKKANKLMNVSPRCKNREKCDKPYFSLLYFALIIVLIALLSLWLSGGLTGSSHLPVTISIAILWFGWIALFTGIGLATWWAIYFFVIPPKKEEIQKKSY